jgi:hypothetical protein
MPPDHQLPPSSSSNRPHSGRWAASEGPTRAGAPWSCLLRHRTDPSEGTQSRVSLPLGLWYGWIPESRQTMKNSMISRSTRASGLFVLAISFCASMATAEPGFPAVRSGVWQLRAERVLPDGKSQSWTRTAEYCRNPNLLFQGYWGLGAVERGGCRFETTEPTGNRYRITSECMVRGVGRVESDAKITLTDDTAFRLEVDVCEGPRHYHATESGQRIGDCSQ